MAGKLAVATCRVVGCRGMTLSGASWEAVIRLRAAMRLALLAAAALAACASEPATGAASREVLVPPADPAFVPFRCGGAAASDPLGDVAGAGQHRDAVGSAARPAALRASADQFLYVRIRP